MANNNEISIKQVQELHAKFLANPKAMAISDAVTAVGLDAVALNRQATVNQQHQFSIELKTGKITAQNKSGRCWLFSGLNTFRYHIIKKHNLDNFELSQSYMMFWDKFEKSNYFLENILETLAEPLDSRLINWLLSGPLNDGGQWDMFVNLVQKYGVVPKSAYPESYSSSNSYRMNSLLTIKLREYAFNLRQGHQSGQTMAALRKLKAKYVKEIWHILVTFLGLPPVKFDFELKTKDDKYIAEHGIDPQTFYKKYVAINLDDYVSIINAPTADKPYNHTFTVQFLGNVVGGKPVHYLNLTSERQKELAVKQLKDGTPVWFGCDVGKLYDRDRGIMDNELYNYSSLLDVDFTLDKAGRLDYGESLMTHAMVFMGVNLVDSKPNRWKVENSWGTDTGKKGWFVMSDDWFSQFNYQIVINKKYLSADEKKALKLAPTVLQPWDPMGSLA